MSQFLGNVWRAIVLFCRKDSELVTMDDERSSRHEFMLDQLVVREPSRKRRARFG